MDGINSAKNDLYDSNAELWPRRYQSFVRLYQGREDVIAEWQEGKYVPRLGSGLTIERFREHVENKSTYAIYNKDDAGNVRFGLFDVDILPRDQGWEKLLLSMDGKKQEVKRIMQKLREMGLDDSNMLIEFPTVGFHLLLFFDEAVPAALLKRLMQSVLFNCGLDKVPFYPRQVQDAPWGDRVQLPLRVNLNTSRRSNFIRDLDAFDPEHYPAEPDFSVLDKIVPISSTWLHAAVPKDIAPGPDGS